MSIEQNVGLIRMNAHLVTQSWARGLMFGGALVALLMGLLLVRCALKRRWRRALVCGVALALAVVAAVIGAKQPKLKVIRACAVGPVSLEVVAATYTIAGIDGSMMTLIEK